MGDIPELERLEFFPGELLTADDLTAIDTNNRAMMELHQRSMHNWGIGFGLDVSGAIGATSVSVTPGYAADINGHDIILSTPLTLAIPAITSGAFYLVADWVDDADEPVVEQRSATSCDTAGGSVRLSDAPAIVWKTLAQLNYGIDVILALVAIRNCAISRISTSVRRYATCGSMFHLQAGSVSAGTLNWALWAVGGVNSGLTAYIDTSAAKFQSTPMYVAQIVGTRSIDVPPTLIIDFVTIANPTPAGFTLQVALPESATSHINPRGLLDPLSPGKLNWSVSWMGVQG